MSGQWLARQMVALSVVGFATAHATTLHVPQTFPSIQAAIDAAVPGDSVLVDAGTYLEHIDFKGKAITVQSVDGPQVTTIDGSQAGCVVTFQSGEGNSSVLAGFTITNGRADWGGGVACQSSSPTLTGNVFAANSAVQGGGAINCVSSSPVVAGNEFASNYAELFGGGAIACDLSSYPRINGNRFSLNSSPAGVAGAILCVSDGGLATATVISDNDFADNAAGVAGAIMCAGSAIKISHNRFVGNVAWFGEGGAIYCENCSPTIDNNLLVANRADTWFGGGIACFQASPNLTNNTLYGNSAEFGGGGVFSHDQSLPLINDSILWANTAFDGAQIWGDATVNYSDVQGGLPGPGNIDADPLFADAAQLDFSLQKGSPCVDQGDPGLTITGRDLAGNPRQLDGDLSGTATGDMGAYEFGNVHLEVSGSFTPGGTFTITSTGDTSLHLILFVGTEPGEARLTPYGPVFFSFASPWLWLPVSWFGQFLTIPTWVVGPVAIVMQELAYDRGATRGNTSNAVAVTIQ